MKIFIYVALLSFSVSACAKPLTLFKTQLEITNKCELKATSHDGKSSVINLNLPESSNCKFIMHDESNLIHLEQISNFYMVLVESTIEENNNCISTHTAVVIKNTGKVVPAGFSKKSLSCNIDREQKLFLHFAYEMKLIK